MSLGGKKPITDQGECEWPLGLRRGLPGRQAPVSPAEEPGQMSAPYVRGSLEGDLSGG